MIRTPAIRRGLLLATLACKGCGFSFQAAGGRQVVEPCPHCGARCRVQGIPRNISWPADDLPLSAYTRIGRSEDDHHNQRWRAG